MLLAWGWLLLLPPAAQNDAQAPLSRWERVGSFGSARECEAVKAELVEAARRSFGDPWMIPDLGDTTQVDRKRSWAESRCVER
jgi:hypothetical protein